MKDLYPEIEPFEQGLLDVGDGNLLYWETCGMPDGKPAVVLHGGPGSGCGAWFRRLFDPAVYRVVLFDQRNCGRSLPNACQPETDLTANTTANLIEDMERLREHLGIERWLVLGGSWGSTLALAYAEAHPERVTALLLFGVTTGRHSEIDWLFRGGLSVFFPEEWRRLCAFCSHDGPPQDIVEDCYRRLNDPDPAVRQRAADAWCLWESATPSWPPRAGLAPRFSDPAYALAYARIVVHYVKHNLWLEDGALLRNADRLASIPGVLVNGRFDLQAPLANAFALRSAWPRAELIVVDDAGHAADSPAMSRALVAATDRLAPLLP